ncbi:TPA: hypothetical protein ACUB60_003363 [Klebsiella variicola]|uniref:hypothetical protein n=1 Tax=Klebsiella variicola TaxID=244366 RepID=UPI001FB4DE19|nr:hypothetical protein [Klebsiella variicola]MCJ0887570.1 hypothetical protein [Klebsiella variicola]MCS5784063.1 hypothetical protein [Klebsiella variicola subsp. variicola]
MSKVKVAPIELEIDATEVINQVEELLGLLELPARSLEGIPEDVVNLLFDNIRPLLNNIVPCLTTSSLVISRPQLAQLTPTKFVSKSKSSGRLSISLPQSGQATFIVVSFDIFYFFAGCVRTTSIPPSLKWLKDRQT